MGIQVQPCCCGGQFALIVNNANLLSDSNWSIYLNGELLRSLNLQIVTDPGTQVNGDDIVTAGMGGIFTDLNTFDLDDMGEGLDDGLWNVLPNDNGNWAGLWPPTRQGYFQQHLVNTRLNPPDQLNRVEMRWTSSIPGRGSLGDIYIGEIKRDSGRWAQGKQFVMTNLYHRISGGVAVPRPDLSPGQFYALNYQSNQTHTGLVLFYEFYYPQ